MKNTFFKTVYFVLLSVICYSCQENHPSPALLVQAQKLAETNPAEALILLDSIHTENMDKDSYMQYIVTHVQAKYKNNQSIANDTLIFEAQDYFDTQKNPAQSALAHFYSGGVYYQNKKVGKALFSFMEADSYAQLSKDTILRARSQNNIGQLYYEQDIMDSAIFHYKLALNCYNAVKDVDQLKMQTTYSMGSAFYYNCDLDSAYYFYNKGLHLANEAGNQKYQVIFTNHLGLVDRMRGNYKEATAKLHWSLAQKTTSLVDSLRIYLNLAKLYNTTEQLDSAHFYTELLKNHLPEIADRGILEGTYTSLLEYNKKAGNYIDALRYAELKSELDKTVKAESQLLELVAADKDYYLSLKDSACNQFKEHIFFWILIGGVVFIILLIFVLAMLRVHRKCKKEVEMKKEEYRLMKERLMAIGAEYDAIDAEIAAMLNDEVDEEK